MRLAPNQLQLSEVSIPSSSFRAFADHPRTGGTKVNGRSCNTGHSGSRSPRSHIIRAVRWRQRRTGVRRVTRPLDNAVLQALATEARNELSVLTPEAVNALVGRDVTFKVGDRVLPFTTEGFLMSFLLPNFFFHATTAYDIGAPLGKRDFMGKLKLKG
jgi:hypothetical protein